MQWAVYRKRKWREREKYRVEVEVEMKLKMAIRKRELGRSPSEVGSQIILDLDST
jgi:hypothetical protein